MRIEYLVTTLLLLCLAACQDPYLYDRTGGQPINPPSNPQAYNYKKIAPDYYYRQSKTYYPVAVQHNQAPVASQHIPSQASQVPVAQQRQQPNFIAHPAAQQFQHNQAPQQAVNHPISDPYQQYQYHGQPTPSGTFNNQQHQQPQVIPGSRFYTNPYAIPPSQRHIRYDTDQYYSPPVQNQNIEAVEPGIRNVVQY